MASPARRVAFHALSDFWRGRLARVGEAVDASRIDARERALARELSHGVLRRRRLLDFVLESFLPRGMPREPELCAALRLGAYQLLFSRVPARAAVHESVDLIAPRGRGVINAVLRRVSELQFADRAPSETSRDEVAVGDDRCLLMPRALPESRLEALAIEYSLPDFLLVDWAARFGEPVAAELAAASAMPPPLHVRATARAGEDLFERLVAEGLSLEPVTLPGGPRDDRATPRMWRVLPGPLHPTATAAFRAGELVVQDPTSMLAVHELYAKPGDVIVDYCAAPGTKTMWLADAVGPNGVVWAYDPDAERRQRIAENAQRLGVTNVRIVQKVTQLPNDVDRVLVDVPCSNSGVLARRVEVRERITPEAIAGLAATQREILTTAATHLRGDGKGELLYATCSIDANENEQVVRRVAAAASTGLRLTDECTTLPAIGQHDGGYWARMQKRD